jgi:tetratricopeptide (TPR) repeat protein
MKPLALACAVAVALAAAPVAAAPPANGANDLLERGLRSYAVGRYDEAIASFRRGYELSPRPEFLYALAQAQRMNGDCRGAVASYRAFLRTSPAERAAAPARQNLQRCEEQLANEPPPSPPAPAPPPSPPAATVTAPVEGALVQPRPPRLWYRDRAGDALAGIGAAALVAGGVLWAVGEAGARGIADASRYDQFASRAVNGDSYDRERTAGIVCVAVGGALAVSAIARWAWVARHR